MSAILTQEVAKEALVMILPAIEALLASEQVKRSALVIVLLNPSNGEVLLNMGFGTLPSEQWPHPFDEIAMAKAKLAYRLKMSCRAAQQHPHLLEDGDTKHRGGVYHQGIAVGVSGVQSYIDEMVAMWMAVTCEMLCRRAFEEVVTHADGDTVKV